ncbi:MAG: hypothetical protein A4E47_00797 [Methanosaeta sp. PtaU1.Bin028]|nr:MAG: hypothetical protein A4E47_00797 [Methanosaeta sp. PtaU1.Bin028]
MTPEDGELLQAVPVGEENAARTTEIWRTLGRKVSLHKVRRQLTWLEKIGEVKRVGRWQLRWYR